MRRITYLPLNSFSTNKFISKSYQIPSPNKHKQISEDNLFQNDHLLTIADGVSAWKSYGVDPALYSKALIENISSLFM